MALIRIAKELEPAIIKSVFRTQNKISQLFTKFLAMAFLVGTLVEVKVDVDRICMLLDIRF